MTLNFNQFDALGFLTGTGFLTVTGAPLINSAVIVALIVLLTKLVEWRSIKSKKAQAVEQTTVMTAIAAHMEETNRVLKKIAAQSTSAEHSAPRSDQ